MAIDFKKMQEKKAALEAKSNGGGGDFWRPQDGAQVIRILPVEDGDPFKEFFFHYNVGTTGFLCPRKNFGDECKVCEFGSSLFREETDESIRMAKELFARQRFFSPVIVRGEEAAGVRVWGYGKGAYESLIKLVLNPQYGDITDMETGVDLDLEYGKPVGAKFPKTIIQAQRFSSKLSEDDSQSASWVESVPEISNIFERRSSADVSKILDEFLASDNSAEASSTEVVKGGTQDVKSVDAAISELLS